jgi:hypothetical protein
MPENWAEVAYQTADTPELAPNLDIFAYAGAIFSA